MNTTVSDTMRARDTYTAVVEAGRLDLNELHELMRRGMRVGNEDEARDLYLNELIPKPWGYEYRVYADDLSDLWQLCLGPTERTSMHAHPRKTTYLLCLSGRGRTEGLRGRVDVATGDLVKIERGAFHRTVNSSAMEDLHLIEVETPRNKFDLLRLRDDYNRAGTGYELESTDLHTTYKRVPYIPGAYMCRVSPCDRFLYRVTSGTDLHYRGVGSGFHVPIGVSAFFSDDLPILRPNGSVMDPLLDGNYLSVFPDS